MSYLKMMKIIALAALFTSAIVASKPASALIPYDIEVTLEGPYLVSVDTTNETEVPFGGTTRYFFFNYHTDREDEFLNGKAVFTSSNPAVGIIDQDGVFTAVGIGTTVVTATFESLMASVTVNVPAPNNLYLRLDKAILIGDASYEISDSTLGIGEHFPYRVFAQSSAGNVQLTDAFTVTSSNPEVLKVMNGELVGIAPGKAVITVQSGQASLETAFYVRVPVPNRTADSNLQKQFNEAADYVNTIRQTLGLKPLTINDNLHLAAQAHADYMRVNGFSRTHYEEAGNPDYFGQAPAYRIYYAGYHAFTNDGATGEVMTLGSSNPVGSLKSLIDAPLHRNALLDPVFREIGIAVSATGQYDSTVANLGVLRIDEADLLPIVQYPYSGQVGVPVEWYNNEDPNPLANFPDAPRTVGYPITISSSASRDNKLIDISASLTDDSGHAVDYYLTKGSTYIVVTPKKPLSPGATYTVHAQGQFENEPRFERKWSFTTESAGNEVEAPSNIGQTPIIQEKPQQPPRAFTVNDVGVRLNGKYVELNPKARVINDSTFIPLRGVFEAMGAKVLWNGGTQQITITKGDTKVLLTVGKKQATVNNKQVTLSVAPFISTEGSTYVPLRFASEALGAKVDWEADRWTAVIDQ